MLTNYIRAADKRYKQGATTMAAISRCHTKREAGEGHRFPHHPSERFTEQAQEAPKNSYIVEFIATMHCRKFALFRAKP